MLMFNIHTETWHYHVTYPSQLDSCPFEIGNLVLPLREDLLIKVTLILMMRYEPL